MNNARYPEIMKHRFMFSKLQNKCKKHQMRNCSTANIIEVYRYCHRLLCQLIHHVNRMFQLQLLTTASACFLCSVCNLYFTIFGYIIKPKRGTNDQPQFELIHLTFWILHYIMRFLLLTISAHTTAQQVSNLAFFAAHGT